MTVSKKQPPTYRLISLDGGGIYGYNTVLMLRALAERNPGFLCAKKKYIFAGTSAGALISLLLAKEENPREALLSGKIERFFESARLHGNQLNPIDAFTSLFGLSSWCGGDDMKSILAEYLGDSTLGELAHHVLIMTFDITGKTSSMQRRQGCWDAKIYHNFRVAGADLDASAAFVAYGAACPISFRPVIDGITDGGLFAMSPTLPAFAELMHVARVKSDIIKEYLEDIEFDLDPKKFYEKPAVILTEQVGMDPPPDLEDTLKKFHVHLKLLQDTLQKLRNNLLITNDETFRLASEALEPSKFSLSDNAYVFLSNMKQYIEVESSMMQTLNHVLHDPFDLHVIPERNPEGEYLPYRINELREDIMNNTWSQSNKILMAAQHFMTHHLNVFNEIEVFSVGVGSSEPFYWRGSFNKGWLNFNLTPTNAKTGYMYPPSTYLLYSPETYSADEVAHRLMGSAYYRLDPDAIRHPVPPVVLCLYLARFRFWREFILHGIRKCFPSAERDIVDAENWLIERNWLGDQDTKEH